MSSLEESRATCQLKKTSCTNIYINTENNECPGEYPLFIQRKDSKECAIEKYNSNIHYIFNKLIKIQWLNKRVKIDGDNCWYITKSFNYGD